MRTLADRVLPYALSHVAASREPKAEATGRLLASHLGVPWSVEDGLHEHDRSGVPFLGRQELLDSVSAFLRAPDRLVFGRETAREALARFSAAVEAALSRHHEGTLALVAHGTVIALYVASVCGGDPFALWQVLGLPSFVALALPEGRVLEVVGHL